MKVGLFNDNKHELEVQAGYLRKCGHETMRVVEVHPYHCYVEFFRMIQANPHSLDLLVVAADGTFSLEVMEGIRELTKELPVIWFSDLDFGVRSYAYGVVWFGKKPVDFPGMKKAFQKAVRRLNI